MGSSKPLILSFQMSYLTPERATQTNEQLRHGDTQLLRETSLDNRMLVSDACFYLGHPALRQFLITAT